MTKFIGSAFVVLVLQGCGTPPAPPSPPPSHEVSPSKETTTAPKSSPSTALSASSQLTDTSPSTPKPRCADVSSPMPTGTLEEAMRSPRFRFPLQSDVLDLDRINAFLALYLASGNPADAPIEAARRSIRVIRENWCGMRVLRLDDDIDSVATVLHAANSNVRSPYPFLSNAYTVLVGTGHALTALKSRYEQSMPADLHEQLDRQLGVDANDESAIYRENVANLKDLLRAAQEYVKTVPAK